MTPRPYAIDLFAPTSDFALRHEQVRDRLIDRLHFVGFHLSSFLFDRPQSSK